MNPYSQNSDELERLGVYESRPEIPPKVRRAILLMIDATTDHGFKAYGEPCKEMVSQGGGFSTLLSGGDERSEPESQIKLPHGIKPPAVSDGKPTAVRHKE